MHDEKCFLGKIQESGPEDSRPYTAWYYCGPAIQVDLGTQIEAYRAEVCPYCRTLEPDLPQRTEDSGSNCELCGCGMIELTVHVTRTRISIDDLKQKFREAELPEKKLVALYIDQRYVLLVPAEGYILYPFRNLGSETILVANARNPWVSHFMKDSMADILLYLGALKGLGNPVWHDLVVRTISHVDLS